MNALDNLPLASLAFVAGIVVVVIAYISNDVTVDQALTDLGILGAGTGVLGYARAQSGKGTR